MFGSEIWTLRKIMEDMATQLINPVKPSGFFTYQILYAVDRFPSFHF